MKPRIKETDQGIQGEFNVRMYDEMQQRFRDKGWMETQAVILSGIDHGLALEVGPGPGYLGLEWLKQTRGTELRGVEISPNMIALAEANAREYGLEERVRYVQGNAAALPFPDRTFDAVFSNGSLHEWADPESVFREIRRVLKPAGRYFISDLRRDVSSLVRGFLYFAAKPKTMRPGLRASLNAAYTPAEIEAWAVGPQLPGARVRKNGIGLEIMGRAR